MPDILIRGMEMPDSCSDCPMCYDMIECTVSPLRFWHGRPENEQFDFCNERHPVCPLVELPPHGDLVDATQYRDEFMDGVYNMCADDPDNNRANVIIDLYDCAPVIVPAERRDADA